MYDPQLRKRHPAARSTAWSSDRLLRNQFARWRRGFWHSSRQVHSSARQLYRCGLWIFVYGLLLPAEATQFRSEPGFPKPPDASIEHEEILLFSARSRRSFRARATDPRGKLG